MANIGYVRFKRRKKHFIDEQWNHLNNAINASILTTTIYGTQYLVLDQIVDYL